MNFKLTTKTLIVDAKISFNLDVIFKFFECDDDIKSIKYNNQLKTKTELILGQKSFYNQITFKSMNSGTSIKIFKNNKIQITGIKSEEEAKSKISSLLLKFKKINGITSVDRELIDNLYIDITGNIYDKNTYKIIGKKNKNGVYILGKNEECIVDKETGLLINKEYKKCIKNIYFYNGDIIGRKEIIFTGKKYYLKRGSCVNEKNEIIKYGSVIGMEKFSYLKNEDEIALLKKEWVSDTPLKVEYKAYEGELNIDDVFYETKMSNYVIDTKREIDRQKIYTVISALGFNTSFDEWCYKGVNLKLFFKKNSDVLGSGICECPKKCVCDKVTLLIFRTGKIIISSSTPNDDGMKIFVSGFMCNFY